LEESVWLEYRVQWDKWGSFLEDVRIHDPFLQFGFLKCFFN
jgi:hypothetical protein